MDVQNNIITLKNGYHIWTQTQGHGKNKLLCLHGGPGSNHELFENYGEMLEKYDIQVIMYDQLGSWYSDQPDFSIKSNQDRFFNINYFVSEVEEVRSILGLNDFFLLGHSWGGMLVQEYALKYADHLTGIIINSMTDDIASYEANINRLRKNLLGVDESTYMELQEAKQNYTEKRYRTDIDILNHNFIVRSGRDPLKHLVSTKNLALYNYFQGDNEFMVRGQLKDWSVVDQIHDIKKRTLLMFGDHDTMDLEEASRMEKRISNSTLKIIKNAGHCNMLDNPEQYFSILGTFINAQD